MFENISYSINSEIIEAVRKPAIVSLVKTLLTYSKSQTNYLENVGYSGNLKLRKVRSSGEKINVILPLNMLFGFCADSSKIFLLGKHKLKLLRSQNDANIFIEGVNTKNAKLEIKKTCLVITICAST